MLFLTDGVVAVVVGVLLLLLLLLLLLEDGVVLFRCKELDRLTLNSIGLCGVDDFTPFLLKLLEDLLISGYFQL